MTDAVGEARERLRWAGRGCECGGCAREVAKALDAFEVAVRADVKRVVEAHWLTRCSNCNRELGRFSIYVEDRDGRTFDGRASVLAESVYCGPKCLKAYAEDYGSA